MSTLYQPVVIRTVDRSGKRCAKGAPGARSIRKRSKTWRGRYRNADGKVCTISLGTDRELAEIKLSEILRRSKRERAGDIDPFEDHRKRPLTEHLEDFRGYLDSKGNTPEHVSLTVSRIEAAFAGCRFEKLADLNAGRVGNWLSDRRKPKKSSDGDVVLGLGIASSNHHLVALKSFGNWLVRDRRASENPFAHLSRMNAKVDVRHERRALSADEMARVIAAAEVSEKTFRGLDGSTRAMIYRVAVLTGMRAKELGSLTQKSFDLESDEPTWTLEAGYSKRRRKDCLPLHHDLVVRLRQWFLVCASRSGDAESVLSFNRAAEAKRERLFPGTWPEKAAKMLRIDLKLAGIDYENEDGIADFHSLRHSFISNLAAGGVHPKVAQQLARHSTITLTMDRYSHIGLIDMRAGLAALPTIVPAESVASRATGTFGEVGVSCGCTIGCTAPVEINHSQTLSTGQLVSSTDTGEKRKNPQIPLENEGFEGVKAVGLEPTTYGLKVRCSTN